MLLPTLKIRLCDWLLPISTLLTTNVPLSGRFGVVSRLILSLWKRMIVIALKMI